MTERPATAGVAGSVPPPAPFDPPASSPFHGLPQPTADDVTQVLLPRAALADLAAAGRDRGMTALDPAARRLAALHDPAERPLFDVPALGPCHPSVAAAVACPDLFLVHAPAPARPRWLAEAVTAAVRSGQRVFVLTHQPDEVVATLRQSGCEAVARAVGADESAEQWPDTAAAWAQRERAAVRDRFLTQMREAADRLTAHDLAAKLDLVCATARAALDRAADTAAGRADESDAGKQLIAERDTARTKRAAHFEQVAAAEKELAELRKQAQPGGFFKRMFGGGKPAELQPKIDAAEARVRELTAAAPPDPDPAYHDARRRLIESETATVRAELTAESERLHAERAAVTVLVESADVWRSRLTEAEAALADLDARPATLTADGREAIRVVVGSPSAVGHDPLASPSHPEAAPPFDRVFCPDADAISDEAFTAAARLGQSWVLLGAVEARHPAYRNGVANGQLPAPPSAFAVWWNTLHDAAWTCEGNCLLARLTAVVGDRHQLTCEPLFGRGDVEVRFVESELAEVLFAPGMSVVEAKTLLAAEANEHRLQTLGPARWHESADELTCCWPLVEAAGLPMQTVDLGAGVCERVAGDGPAALTAAVVFATPAGWTRESAADWLAARTRLSARTAVL